MLPALLLFRAWLSGPERGVAGVVGVVLILWSVLPVAARRVRPAVKGEMWSGARSLADFLRRVDEAWQRERARAGAGVVGFGLFLWSIWPLASMR